MPSWLDFRLGLRMLVRYPVLTVVGGLAMAFAIGAGAGIFEAIQKATNPVLPLPEGDRVVGLGYWDTAEHGQRPASPYDFLAWRAGLRTVEDIGAFRLRQQNLIVGREGGEPVDLAEISASAFRLAGAAPVLGRPLLDADEAAGAEPVAVIGHRLWHRRFAADPGVVGRSVQLGGTRVTIVGVMPERFAFPVSQHLWTPLRPSTLPQQPGRGALRVFGRLADGATMRDAETEMSALADRARSELPKAYATLAPQVVPYPASIIAIPSDFLVRAGIQSINVFAALFLIIICGNVALLMFARAASREREILVRGALGASRGRIVMQLFAEALVLGAIAAAIGLTFADLGFRWMLDLMSDGSDEWPFWITGGLSPATLAYAVGLTLLASVIAGVVPALKVTTGRLETRLREASGGTGGLRMGGIWTVLIVAQIALTVLFTAVAYVAHRQAAQIAATTTAFPVGEYVAARVEMERPAADAVESSESDDAFLRNYGALVRSLEQRLATEPAVAAVTIAERLPLLPQSDDLIEVDQAAAEPSGGGSEYRVATTAVAANFFDVFHSRPIAGRLFSLADVTRNADAVVVNQLFVERVLQGRPAIGRRIRMKAEGSRVLEPPGQWLEIVGVIPDLVMNDAPLKLDNPAKPVVYRALRPTTHPLHVGLRAAQGAPIASMLRQVATELDPRLRLTAVTPLDQATRSDAGAWRVTANVIVFLSAITLFLSLAGIYAVMSFVVTRRTREIAVRVALGAHARAVVIETVRRPLTTVAVGAVLGCVPLASLVALSMRSQADLGAIAERALVLVGYTVLMIAVCATACLGPLRRALRVQPIDALREEQ
jgi:predicted permease